MRWPTSFLPLGLAVLILGSSGTVDAQTGGAASKPVPRVRRSIAPGRGSRHSIAPRAVQSTTSTGSSSLHFYGFYDPATGAAIEGDTWTFDHGAADPFEGCYIPAAFEPPLPWRRIDAAAWAGHYNTPAAPVIAGSASMWVGYFEDEACAHGYVGGLGYGDEWQLELRSPPLAVTAGTAITVAFDCFYDAEPGYDFVYVAIEQDGVQTVLGTLSGQAGTPAAPVHLSYPTVIQSSSAFRVLFRFVSDGNYSDEDGIYSTALGPFGLDNVDVQGAGVMAEIPPPYDFESGMQGFTASTTPNPSLVGLNDILAYGPAPTCAPLSGNVVEFHDDAMRHPDERVDVLASNAVPLPATTERLNIFAEFDMYAESMMDIIGWNVAWSYYPFHCALDGTDHWSPVLGYLNNYTAALSCGLMRSFATDSAWIDVIPPGADSVRFFLRIGSYFSHPYADTPYPLFDNLRVGISHRATVLHVPSPSYPNIQAAVTAAPSGDTVMVAPGVYQGAGNRDIDFGGKQIVLIGEGGSDATTVDCEGSGRGIVFANGEGPGAVVCGLRFVNGDPSGTDGGAIRVENASPTFVDCVAESSTTTGRGGGVYVNGNPLFLDCRIGFNDTPVEGGGIYVDGGDPQFVDCTVSYNTSGLDGGGIAVAGGGATFTRCQLSSNSSSASGGGFAVLGGTPAADTCGLDGNSADVDGGGMLVSGGSPSFTLCAALSNTASRGGGIMTTSAGAPTWTQCIIGFNNAYSDGAGVCVDGGNPTFAACSIEANQTSGSGGGAWVVSGAPVWQNCELTQNVATTGEGGGMLISQGAAQVEGAWIAGNRAFYGGGLSVQQQAAPSIRNSLIAGNLATFDGGGAWVAIGSGVTASFDSCTIARNSCGETGGGLFVGNSPGGADQMPVGHTIVEGNCGGGADDLELVTSNPASGIVFTCSAIDPANVISNGTIVYAGGHVTTSPQFCAPELCSAAPTTDGDYSLDAGSPCTVDNSPCGVRIGARNVGCGNTGTDESETIPAATRLLPAAPSPFRSTTTVSFDLAHAGFVRLRIYDVSGRLLRTLAEGRFTAARHRIVWDGRDASGRTVPAGVCFARLEADGRTESGRMLVVR